MATSSSAPSRKRSSEEAALDSIADAKRRRVDREGFRIQLINPETGLRAAVPHSIEEACGDDSGPGTPPAAEFDGPMLQDIIEEVTLL